MAWKDQAASGVRVRQRRLSSPSLQLCHEQGLLVVRDVCKPDKEKLKAAVEAVERKLLAWAELRRFSRGRLWPEE
jgi:hypothetical protein